MPAQQKIVDSYGWLRYANLTGCKSGKLLMHVAGRLPHLRPAILVNSVTTPQELPKSSALGRMHMQATAILLLQLPFDDSLLLATGYCVCRRLFLSLLLLQLLPLLLLLSNQSASKSQTLTYNPIHGFKLTYLPATTAPDPTVDNGGRFRIPDGELRAAIPAALASDLGRTTQENKRWWKGHAIKIGYSFRDNNLLLFLDQALTWFYI